MTYEEALAKIDTEWWKNATFKQIVDFQLYEDRLCMPFGLFQEAVESVLGRPVWTHEFARPESLRQEYEGFTPAPSMEGIITKLTDIMDGKTS